MLTATDLRMATCPMSQPLEITDIRRRLRGEILDDAYEPQLIVRIGWAPIASEPLPATPRRPVTEIVDTFPT